MTWFLTARRVPVAVLPGLVLFTILTALGRQTIVPIPEAMSGPIGNPMFVPQLAPLLVTVALGYGLTQRLTEAESCAIRRIRTADIALSVVSCAVAMVAALTVASATDSAHAAQAARNMPFLIGVMLIALAIQPQAATAAPVAWMFIVEVVGRHGNQPRHWAVTAMDAGSPPALVGCLTVFVLGICCYLFRYRR